MDVSHRQLGLGNDDEREDILVVKAGAGTRQNVKTSRCFFTCLSYE